MPQGPNLRVSYNILQQLLYAMNNKRVYLAVISSVAFDKRHGTLPPARHARHS